MIDIVTLQIMVAFFHRHAFLAVVGLSLFLVGCSIEQLRSLAVYKALAVSPDGQSIAAGRYAGNVVDLFDAHAGSFQRYLRGDTGFAASSMSVGAVSFSYDSRYLAAAGINNSVVIWDLTNNRIVANLAATQGARVLRFSPNDYLLAIAGARGQVTLWKIPDGVQVGKPFGPLPQVLSLAFSLNGKLLAAGGSDHTVSIWDIENQQPIRKETAFSHPVHSVAFSRDGESLAVYAWDLTLWKWAGETPQEITISHADTSRLESVEMLVGLLSLVSTVRTIQLTGAPLGYPSRPRFIDRAITERFPVVFSPDGTHLGILRFNPGWSGDHEIVLLDIKQRTIKTAKCQCFAIEFTSDSKWLVVAGFGISLLDVATSNWINVAD